MPKRSAFPTRPTRMILVLLAAVSLLSWAEAQHGGGGGGGHGGGGGGHSGGGHVGSAGHSSAGGAGKGIAGSHGMGRVFGWLHHGSGNSKNRPPRKPNQANTADTFYSYPSAGLPGRATRKRQFPSTYIQTIPLAELRASYLRPAYLRDPYRRSRFFAYRSHPNFSSYRFRRFPTTGCFFTGIVQSCYFEPALPLFWYTGFWYGGWGWDSYDSGDSGDFGNMSSGYEMPPRVAAESEENANDSGNLSAAATPVYVPKFPELDRRFFVLVLTNGTTHVVSSYWLEDGYLEYTSRDGTQSHIPIEALNLRDTVAENSARGLPFVLRSAPENQ